MLRVGELDNPANFFRRCGVNHSYRRARLRRVPIEPAEIAGAEEFVTSAGDLRTLPLHWPADEPRMAGLDGFFAARLQRAA